MTDIRTTILSIRPTLDTLKAYDINGADLVTARAAVQFPPEEWTDSTLSIVEHLLQCRERELDIQHTTAAFARSAVQCEAADRNAAQRRDEEDAAWAALDRGL